MSEPQGLTKRFLPQVASAGFANAVGAAIAALGGLVIARGLGPSGRGVVAGASAWAGLLGLLVSLGLVQAVTYYAARQPAASAWLLRRAVGWVLPPALLVALLGLGFSVARLHGGARHVYGAALVAIPLTVVGGLYVAALLALRTKWWNVARLMQQVLYLTGIALVYAAGWLQLEAVAVVLLMSVGTQLFVARALVLRTAPRRETEPGFSSGEILRYGRHNLLAAVPTTVNARLDQALLAVLASRSQLGAYAAAVSLSLSAGPLASAFGSIAFPRIASLAAEVDRRTLERTALLGCVGVASVICMAILLWADPLVRGLFGSDFAGAVPLVRILAPAGVALATNLVLADLLRGRGRPGATAVAEGTSAAVTVVLLVALIPRYQAMAAAWTSLAAYCLSTILLIAFLRDARRA